MNEKEVLMVWQEDLQPIYNQSITLRVDRWKIFDSFQEAINYYKERPQREKNGLGEDDPETYYVASACSGILFRSTNSLDVSAYVALQEEITSAKINLRETKRSLTENIDALMALRVRHEALQTENDQKRNSAAAKIIELEQHAKDVEDDLVKKQKEEKYIYSEFFSEKAR